MEDNVQAISAGSRQVDDEEDGEKGKMITDDVVIGSAVGEYFRHIVEATTLSSLAQRHPRRCTV
jgi:hypothetical protein